MRNPASALRVGSLRRFGLGAALLLAASAMSGCSFSWDSSGIGDIFLGGRKAADIVADGQPPPEPGSEAEARAAAEAQAAAEAEESGSSLRKVAILPVAYTDGATAQPCDLCPTGLAMRPTGRLQARLATGFIYEAIARHPRFLFPTPEVVDRAMAGTATSSMRETAKALAASGLADWVVVAALLELRPRVGSDEAPEQTAGVVLYASLVDARTGNVVWSDTFDRNEPSRGFVYGTYDKVMNDRPVRYKTADAYVEDAVDELIDDLVDEIR
jgi:hypothetical protein